MASQLMGLSLFIMLLAFFIVLNAISNFDEVKQHKTIASVTETFGSEMAEEDLKPSVRPDEEKSINEGDTLDKMEALFNAHIAGILVEQDKERGVMHMRMPLEKFEAAVAGITGGADDEEANFAQTVITLMKTEARGHPYRMDMVVNVEQAPAQMQNEMPKKTGQIMQRAAALGIQLENNGLPKRLMSVGLNKGTVGDIDLYFRKHTPFSPVDPDVQKPEAQTPAERTDSGDQP